MKGLFKKKPSGSETASPQPVSQFADSVSQSSGVSGRNSFSLNSQSPSPPAPIRRSMLPRQKTTDHISPPPIEDGEIDVFRTQIEDLARCVNNNTLFDFLISDIDRNRLTQITMILADRGDYPAMARVMELIESLDRLIATRMEETRNMQRQSLVLNVETGTIDEILQQADAILQDTSISGDSLKAKIREFDYHFFRHQHEPFDKVLELTEKIDEMRKRAREATPQPIQRTESPQLDEPWVEFPSHPAEVVTNAPAAVPSGWSASVSVGDGSSPEEIHEVYAPPAVETIEESSREPEMVLLYKERLLKSVLTRWFKISSLRKLAERVRSAHESRTLLEWHCTTLLQRHERARCVYVRSKIIRGWLYFARASRSTQAAFSDRQQRRIMGPVLAAWRSYTVHLKNQVFVLALHIDELNARSMLSLWYEWVKGENKLKESYSIIHSQLGSRDLQMAFHGWRRTYTLQRKIRHRQLEFFRECLREWNLHVTKTQQVRNRVESLKKAHSILSEWRAKTRKVSDVFEGESWQGGSPTDDAREESSISIPSTVEYYVIHDPTESPRSEKDAEITDIKRRTQDVITRAQVFISQRKLTPLASAPPLGGSPPPIGTIPRKPDPDHFFNKFERKWAIEQSKWKL